MATPFNRRRLCKVFTAGVSAWYVPGVFAEELTRTPQQTEGPFYPDRLPLDTDNDLLVINDTLTPAVGEITHLSGRILDESGNPIRNAVIEIWQCDSGGRVPAFQNRKRQQTRSSFSRLRSFPDRQHRRIRFSHDQAGILSRSHAAYSCCRDGPRPREVYHAVLYPGAP